MITPIVGHTYIIHHSSGNIVCKFIREAVYNPVFNPNRFQPLRSHTHYVFENLRTSREIVIKSRVKIRHEVTGSGV